MQANVQIAVSWESQGIRSSDLHHFTPHKNISTIRNGIRNCLLKIDAEHQLLKKWNHSSWPNWFYHKLPCFLDSPSQVWLPYSFLPGLVPPAGPLIQMVTSFLILPFTPSSVMDSASRRLKWRTTFVARTGFVDSPSTQIDLILTSSLSAQHLVIFSI